MSEKLDGAYSLDDFKKDYPDIAKALITEGRQAEKESAKQHASAMKTQFEDLDTKRATSDPDGLRAVWDKDPRLQDAFDGDFEVYAAYKKAIANNLVRIV